MSEGKNLRVTMRALYLTKKGITLTIESKIVCMTADLKQNYYLQLLSMGKIIDKTIC